jgi:hypothetical protein
MVARPKKTLIPLYDTKLCKYVFCADFPRVNHIPNFSVLSLVTVISVELLWFKPVFCRDIRSTEQTPYSTPVTRDNNYAAFTFLTLFIQGLFEQPQAGGGFLQVTV